MNVLDKLPAQTDMGAVRLRVRDMKAVYDFYTTGVGLQEIPTDNNETWLGLGDKLILILEHDATLRHPSRTEAGLFHVAVLFDNPHDLALSLVSTLARYQERYAGAGDHLVSEAFYFADPEGNGVELYHDRPRNQWQWNNGHVAMDTLYIDPVAFIKKHAADEEIGKTITEGPNLTGKVGHVHLQVGDVETAHAFYVKALGFDETARLGSQALFVSAGGYHHHMAMNTWNSSGASARQKTLGLGLINLTVPEKQTLEAVSDRLTFAGIESNDDGTALTFLDPWNNSIRLTTAA